MIRKIYDDIIAQLKANGFVPSKEYFDTEQIPENINDKAFILSPPEFQPGDNISQRPLIPSIINYAANIRVFMHSKIPAKNVIEAVIKVSETTETVITKILSIPVGSNEKDSIELTGSNFVKSGSSLVFEAILRINYRVNTI